MNWSILYKGSIQKMVHDPDHDRWHMIEERDYGVKEFSGTQEELDTYMDEITGDDYECKVIGIYKSKNNDQS